MTGSSFNLPAVVRGMTDEELQRDVKAIRKQMLAVPKDVKPTEDPIKAHVQMLGFLKAEIERRERLKA